MSTQTAFTHAIARDDALVCDFFVKFSRFECALKKVGFVKPGAHDSAIPAWGEFADTLSGKLDTVTDADFIDAKSFLMREPPRRQVFVAPNGVGWEANPRRANESDARYLLRLIRDVRNNLFHGGKYPATNGGPITEASLRNAALLRACLVVLDHCLSMDGFVGNAFSEHG